MSCLRRPARSLGTNVIFQGGSQPLHRWYCQNARVSDDLLRNSRHRAYVAVLVWLRTKVSRAMAYSFMVGSFRSTLGACATSCSRSTRTTHTGTLRPVLCIKSPHNSQRWDVFTWQGAARVNRCLYALQVDCRGEISGGLNG
jgi:hypothetical protein